MRFTPLEVEGAVLIEPDVYRDARGFFLETFHAAKYGAAGIPEVFVQDNHSSSVRDTLRGLHLQIRKPQGKLIRVAAGEIWDVAVDVRPDSPTFRQWTAAVLSAENFAQLYIPAGCAHGFCVLSETAHVEYKCTELYDPADETGIAYDDPELAIPWPIAQPVLSERDRRNGSLADYLNRRLPETGRRETTQLLVEAAPAR
jgi:dTDP-4-dehydrorhamnose 3,5-epimerase